MNKRTRTAVTIGVSVALFVGGWVGGTLWSVHRMSRIYTAHMMAELWLGQIAAFPARMDGTLLHNDMVPKALGSGLDGTSIGLSYVYDDLSAFDKGSIDQYLKQAQNVVTAQSGKGLLEDRSHLAIFVHCAKEAEAAGQSVQACARARGMYTPSAQTLRALSGSGPVPAPRVSNSGSP
jgi:hypothetical protein